MQEPANMPFEVILQEDEMKHELMTFQFQSIWMHVSIDRWIYGYRWIGCTEILHSLPPPMPPWPSWPPPVAAGMAEEVIVICE